MTPERGSPFDRRDALAMAALFVLALVLRLVYLSQADSLPFFEFPLIDARSYDEWGRAIASGDWLGDRVFYQAPAYPYFLGIVYTIFGADLAWAHTSQMVLGALSCVFLYLATRQIFDRKVAIVAGLILAGYAPALFFDGMIQKTSLGLFLTTGLLALLAGFATKPTLGRIGLAGVVAGLLALTRENALIFAVVVPAWIVLRYPGAALSRRFALSGAFALGIAIVLLPVGFRNLAVGDTFAITTSQLGPNFFIGNNAEATGLYRPLMPGRQTPDFEGRDASRAAAWETGRELPPGEVSDYWFDRSLSWIAEEPGRWMVLLGHKTLFTLNDYEIPDTEDIYVHAEFSSVLAALHTFLRFGVVLPLGLAGLVFAWRERSAGGAGELVALLAAVFTGAVALFYVWARYRFPLVPLLVPFAALALVRGFTLARGGEWRSLAGPGIVLVLGAAVANLSLFDREALSQAAWVNLGNIMIRESRLDEAESYLDRAVAIEHESAGLHFHVAVLRFRQDRMAEAEPSLRRMLALDPNDFRGHRMLAQLLRADGRREEANDHMKESVRLNPDRARKGRAGAPRPPEQRR